MGDCCNARTLSFVSASFQMVGCIILITLIGLCGVLVSEVGVPESDEGQFLFAMGFVVCLVLLIGALIQIIFLIVLIVGVKKNHPTLVAIYVYPTIFFMVIQAIGIVSDFIMGFAHDVPASRVFLGLFYNLLGIGFSIFMFSPIYIYHTRLRKSYYQSEQHDMRNNVAKAHYTA